MPRPPEYDRLLKIGSFKAAVPSKDSISQFLRTADDMLVAAVAPPITKADADAMHAILADMLPAAKLLIAPLASPNERG